MPIYSDIPDDGFIPRQTPLVSSLGIGPKVTKAIDDATKEWLDKHPEATTSIGNKSIVNRKLADSSVDSRTISDGSVTTDKIADSAVTTPKIANDAVTTDKLADNSVTSDKMVPSAADGLRVMSTMNLGVAKVGAGLAMNGDALELDGNGDITTAVTTWLNAHPEATTTVQDGSITIDKLNADVMPGIYYDEDFVDEQAFPLTVGTITDYGLTVNVMPNGIVEIDGTTTAHARFKLNDGLMSGLALSDFLQTDHRTEPGWYVIRTQLLSGTYTVNTTSGDRAGIYFFFGDDESWPRSSQTRIYAYDQGWTTRISSHHLAKTLPLTNIVLFTRNGDTFNKCRLKIDFHKVGPRDRVRQSQLMDGYPYDLKKNFYWVHGTATHSDVDGLSGTWTRLTNEMPVKFDTDVYVASNNPDYGVAVQQYLDPDDIMTESSTYYDYDYTPTPRMIPAGMLFRVFIKKGNNESMIYESNVNTALNSLVLYKDSAKQDDLEKVRDFDIVTTRNPEAINMFSAMIRGGAIKVAHITDTHSDPIRWNNFVSACEVIKPDVVIHTGDVAKVDMRDDITYFIEHLPSIPLLLSIGNHDVGTGHDMSAGGIDTSETVVTWVNPINEKYGWNNQHPYYYYDFQTGSQKVRFINLYAYDYDENDGDVFIDRVGIYYTQQQIDWLIATLIDAKANGFSVVVAAHEPDKVLPYEQGFGKFNSISNLSSHTNKRTNESPVCDIIEAFINGSSINRTYVQANSLAPNVPSITVNATFSGNGDFVCWLTGHRHGDYYGWLPDTHQLLITLAAGCVGISTPDSTLSNKDLGQRLGTKTEDCFNLYVIKPAHHKIGLIRVGADTIRNYEKRDWMIQDWKDYSET